ncbi:hypothetical protein ACHAW5_002541 [Stephanodiscus triporus]|uniref:Uncharacterized protein n=1 Tax=Stephanodiscus triporus TaxID=2934178 RepID=A0ABD3PL73_9STRA
MDGGIVIGGMPIRFVLECSVDDDGKMLEIPLYAVPSSSTTSSSSVRQQRRLQEELEISSDILQELSQNYNVETSASFVSLALCQRYIKSSIVTATARSSYGIPTMKVSNRLLCMLEEMQRNEDRKSMPGDNDATAAATTATTRYCWILPAVGDRDRGEKSNNDVIDTIIRNNGLPLYHPLRRIQNEGALQGDDGGGGGGGDGGVGTDKKPSLTFEQQAKQLQLQSAWKIAMQKEDAGALGRIRKAMEELENEVMMMEVGEGEDEEVEGENSTLMKIRRAMMSNAEDGEDVVGLMLDLEEAAMIKTDTDDDDV